MAQLRRRRVLELVPAATVFLLFFAARGVYLPLTPLYVEEVTGSYYLVGLAAMASSVALAASQYAWGALSDIVGRRGVAVAGLASLSLVLAVMPLATHPLQLVALRAVEGIAVAAIYTSVPAAVGDAAATLELGFGSAMSLARMLGSAGFATSALLSSQRIMSYGAAFALAALLCALAIPPAMAIGQRPARAAGFSIVGARRHLPLLTAAATWSMVFMAVTSLWPNYMASLGYGFSDVYLYWALAAYGEAPLMLLCGLIVDRDLMRGALAASSASLALTYLLYTYAPSRAGLLIAQVFRSIAYAFFEISTLAYATRAADEAHRGGLVGLRNTAVSIGWILGSLYGGLMAESLGLKRMIESCVLLLAVPTILFLKGSKRLD